MVAGARPAPGPIQTGGGGGGGGGGGRTRDPRRKVHRHRLPEEPPIGGTVGVEVGIGTPPAQQPSTTLQSGGMVAPDVPGILAGDVLFGGSLEERR